MPKYDNSVYRLTFSDELIDSKEKLLEFYEDLTLRKGTLSKSLSFEIQPCGRKPMYKTLDSKRIEILTRIFTTLDLLNNFNQTVLPLIGDSNSLYE